MPQLPEWFVSGPLHGQNRRDTHPYTGIGYEWLPINVDRFTYHVQRFYIGNRVIVFWWGFDTSREIAASLLADLLLAPHENTEPNSTHRQACRRCAPTGLCPLHRGMPDNTGDADRWEDPRDTSGGSTDAELLARAVKAEKEGAPE